MEDAAVVSPEGGRGPVGKVRPFSHGFLLTIVTLGLYPLFWHHRVHDELMRYLGRPNRLRFVWLVHVLLIVGAVVWLASSVAPAFQEHGAGYDLARAAPPDPTLQQDDPVQTVRPTEGVGRGSGAAPGLVDFLQDHGLYSAFLFFLIGINVSFASYVALQYVWLYRARGEDLGACLAGAALFLVLIGAWMLVGRTDPPSLLRFLLLVLPVGAYYHLQTGYNEFWSEVGGVVREGSALGNVVQGSAGCDQCGGLVGGAGTAGAELTVACPACGWRNTLRLRGDASAESEPSPAATS